MSTQFPQELLSFLRAARQMTVLTGAGISAESGIPTFRDAQTGLWASYNPQELATRDAFRRNPKLVWEWYTWRRTLMAGKNPNPGHRALAEMESQVVQHGSRFSLITQNIDGLHNQAGNRNIIELHGNIQQTKCFQEDLIIDSWTESGEIPPRCPRCGGLLRPNVVWFGELLPKVGLQTALEISRTCDIFFSIGTSGVVQPAASMPFLALENGAVVVEINPEETPLSEAATYTFHEPAGSLLPALVQEVWD